MNLQYDFTSRIFIRDIRGVVFNKELLRIKVKYNYPAMRQLFPSLGLYHILYWYDMC